MERWRTFFANANADIWTVIQQAINVAATDHPKLFKEKRGDIAETLFSRHLVQMMRTDEFVLSGSVGAVSDDDDQPSVREEGELKDDHEERRVPAGSTDGLHVGHDEVADLMDDVDHETLLIQEINDIKQSIGDDEQSEGALLDLLQRLEDMQITVNALKVTEIGKQVNVLRKHPSKYVKAVVKRLVKHWKSLVDEWVKIAGDTVGASTSPAIVAGSHVSNTPEATDRLQQMSHTHVKKTFPSDNIFSGEPTRLFSFIDQDTCGQDQKRARDPLERSDKGHNSSLSQSGSVLTYSSDCDVRVSASHTWGLRTPGEMGSATRDGNVSETTEKVQQSTTSRGSYMKCDTILKSSNQPIQSQPISRIFPDSSSARIDTDAFKATVNSSTGRSIHESSSARNYSHVKENERTSKSSSMMNKAERSQVDQKLEIAKRKLHEGYLQAENAKKQRTVQVLDFSNLPKSSEMQEKMNVATQSKGRLPGGQWGQSRRHG